MVSVEGPVQSPRSGPVPINFVSYLRTVRHKEAEKEKERLAKLKAELEAGEQRLRQLDSQVEDDDLFGTGLGDDPADDQGDGGDEDEGADEAEEEEAYQPVSPAYLPSGGAKTKPVNIMAISS